MNPLPRITFHFLKPQTETIQDLYRAIKSYYAKSNLWEKKKRNRMSFYKTQELSENIQI